MGIGEASPLDNQLGLLDKNAVNVNINGKMLSSISSFLLLLAKSLLFLYRFITGLAFRFTTNRSPNRHDLSSSECRQSKRAINSEDKGECFSEENVERTMPIFRVSHHYPNSEEINRTEEVDKPFMTSSEVHSYRFSSEKDFSGFIDQPEAMTFRIRENIVDFEENYLGFTGVGFLSAKDFSKPAMKSFSEEDSYIDDFKSCHAGDREDVIYLRSPLFGEGKSCSESSSDDGYSVKELSCDSDGFELEDEFCEQGQLESFFLDGSHVEDEKDDASKEQEVVLEEPKDERYPNPVEEEFNKRNQPPECSKEYKSNNKLDILLESIPNASSPCMNNFKIEFVEDSSDEELSLIKSRTKLDDIGESLLMKAHQEPTAKSVSNEPEHNIEGHDTDKKEPEEKGKTEEPNHPVFNAEELDELCEHHDLIEQLKMELKKVRAVGLPTILEESESPRAAEYLKPFKIDEKFGRHSSMDELQKFYKSYRERMRKLDILCYQKMYAMGFLQMKKPLQATATQRPLSSNILGFLSQNFLPLCLRKFNNDPSEKLIKDLQCDLETVYVGQTCLSWEFLRWQYEKSLEMPEFDICRRLHYNKVAGEFQQFQVLIQRFTENEPFEGPRLLNYVKKRCLHRNLLQVPLMKEDGSKNNREKKESNFVITSEMLEEIMEEAIRIFWEFVKAEKYENLTFFKVLMEKNHVVLQDPSDYMTFVDLQSRFQKKEKKLMDLLKSEKHSYERWQIYFLACCPCKPNIQPSTAPGPAIGQTHDASPSITCHARTLRRAFPGRTTTALARGGMILKTATYRIATGGCKRQNKHLADLIRRGQLREARRVFDALTHRNVVTWNSMISGYVRHGELALARHLFDKMPQRDLISWNCLLSGYTMSSDPSELMEAHRLFDQMPVKDAISWNTLIGGYARNGKMVQAMQLFGGMPERNVVSWNTVITGFLRIGDIESAVELYDIMPVRDAASVSALVSGFIQNNMLDEATKVLLRSTKASEMEGSIDAYNTLIAGYGKVGRVKEARMLFNMIPCHQNHIEQCPRMIKCFHRNVVSWNSMIMCYVKAGDLLSARELFDEMPERDLISWNTMIMGYAQSLAMDKAEALFQQLDEPDARSWNSMLCGFAQKGELEKARNLFDRFPYKEIVTWNTMIAGYVQNGNFEEAIRLFCSMLPSVERFDKHTVSSLLSACAGLASLRQGIQIHQLILKALIPDIPINNSLINMYSRCGSVIEAKVVFDSMEALRDVISWNSMIGGFAHHGFAIEALHLYKEMKESKIRPTEVTFIAVLHACGHAGLVENGKIEFDSMVNEFGLSPNVEHYATLVDLIGRHGQLDEAMKVIKGMLIPPDRAVWGALLGACHVHKKSGLAQIAAEALAVVEPSSSAPYVLRYNIHADEGRWEEALQVRESMDGKGVFKQPGYSWIELENKVHVFIAGDCSHPRSFEICSLLDSLNRLIRGSHLD
ncbi:hypothetical protein HPP92_016100 [Vanilla planifolia]|uniref:Pentatricopeptide repeat-containing protein n=1 Tax=Vanilla planifolia TaxID=51239 RepID=A0A835QKV8_VANPL|nr:hypothetical protein HPP92_016100 [Vanilla planifolia]